MTSNGGEICVLHVDDDPDLGNLVATHLERIHDDITVCAEQSAQDGLERLETTAIDCVVSDHDMPKMNGLEFLKAVRSEYPDLPFILFTGKGSEEIASDAISAGVTEYLEKGVGTDQYTVLANRIERAVGEDRAKTALEESERMLSTLISNLPGMVYRARNEPGWPMEFVSDGAEELVGYSSEAIESGDVSWGDLIHDSDTDRLWQIVQTCIDADEPFEVSYKVETREGDIRWLWERGRVVDVDDGVEVLEGFITDVTARKERERELEQEREFTEKLVNAIDDVFYVAGPDGSLIRWNERVNEVTGYTDEELARAKAGDLIAESHHEELVDVMKETLRTGHGTLEAPLITADGERLQYEFKGSRLEDSNGEVLGVAGIGRDIGERERRERELRQYKTLVENVGDPMYILDTEGYIQMANKAMCEYLKLDREEIVGTDVKEFIAEEDHAEGLKLTKELLASDERSWATYEMLVTHSNGPDKLVENKIAVLTDDDGEFIGSVGIVRDITERKKREQKRKQYETLVENVGDPMYVLDADGTIEMANEAMAALLDCDPSDIVGSEPERFMPDEDVEKGGQVILDILKDDDRTWGSFEMETIDVHGNRNINEDKVAPLYTEDGEFDGTVGIIRDISDRKERERELERYETIIEAVGDPVYTLDENGVFTYVNEAVERMTGFEPSALIGRHIASIMTQEDIEKGNQLIRELLTDPDRENAILETVAVNQDGEHIPIEIHMALLPREEGEFNGTAGVIRDISEQKARERQLSEFASVVSHDLRNPLNVVKGRLSLARETGDLEHLDDAESAANRMDELINDLLTLARQGETVGEKSVIDSSVAANRAWSDVDTGDARLVHDGATRIEADPARLRELFENLFRNAVEHGSTSNQTESDDAVEHGSTSPQTASTDAVEHGSTSNQTGADDAVEHGSTSSRTQSDDAVEGGSTSNRTESDDAVGQGQPSGKRQSTDGSGEGTDGAEEDDLTVTVGSTEHGFYVADDGQGIPPTERSKIFERGYTTTTNGTGFGLAIVKDIATAHDWDVEVSESAAGGARFDFMTTRPEH